MSTEKALLPRVGVGIIVIKDKKILLGKRKGSHGAGAWACPGGHLEYAEEVLECAKRELAEETGLRALTLVPGPWVNNMIDHTKHYVTAYVFVTAFEGEVELLEKDKCESWGWFNFDALPWPLFPTMVSLLDLMSPEELLKRGS